MERYGISRSTIYRILKERGTPTKVGGDRNDRAHEPVPSNGSISPDILAKALSTLALELAETKLRVKLLEKTLQDAGISLP